MMCVFGCSCRRITLHDRVDCFSHLLHEESSSSFAASSLSLENITSAIDQYSIHATLCPYSTSLLNTLITFSSSPSRPCAVYLLFYIYSSPISSSSSFPFILLINLFYLQLYHSHHVLSLLSYSHQQAKETMMKSKGSFKKERGTVPRLPGETGSVLLTAPVSLSDIKGAGRRKSQRSVIILCFALPCLALPCLALPCLALPCLALPCPAFALSYLT